MLKGSLRQVFRRRSPLELKLIESALTVGAVVIVTKSLHSENRLQYISKDLLASQLKVLENNPHMRQLPGPPRLPDGPPRPSGCGPP